MYGPEATTLRRCLGVRADGSPCRAWAVWGVEQQLCVAHCGRPRRTRRGQGSNWPYQSPPSTPARYRPCLCVAYAWPHRPGGGLCAWPLEPTYRLTRPAGAHSLYWSRTSRAMKAFGREYRAWLKTRRLPRTQDLPPELAKLLAGGKTARKPKAVAGRRSSCAEGSALRSSPAPKGSESVLVVPPIPERNRSGKHLSKSNSSAGRVA